MKNHIECLKSTHETSCQEKSRSKGSDTSRCREPRLLLTTTWFLTQFPCERVLMSPVIVERGIGFFVYVHRQ